MLCFSHSKNPQIADQPILDHFGEAGGDSRPGGFESVGVREHDLRLIERADHVLAARMVDSGFAAHRRIDLREERGRGTVNVGHAAQVRSGGKTREIAIRPAANATTAVCARSGEPACIEYRVQRLPAPCRFPVVAARQGLR